MGGTLSNIYNNTLLGLNKHVDAMSRLQEQISTGSRINRASDDPSSAYRVLGLNSQGRELENYVDNLLGLMGTLELSCTVIEDMISYFGEARVRVTQISSGIFSDDERERTADGINDILEQIVSLANTKQLNQYLFGGSSTASPPYVVERTDGEITSVTYQGSFEERSIEIAPAMESSTFYIGDDIFCSNDRSAPIFIGDTGAAAGTGTPNVTGYTWLMVTDVDDNGTFELSIDGGLTSVDADGTANQILTDSRTGKVLYVDTTGITSTGYELVNLSGTHDIFNSLITLRDVLRNDRGLSNAQLQAALNDCSNTLEEMDELLLQTSVAAGSKIGFLETLKESMEKLTYDVEDEVTRLEEADIAQITIDLSRREVLYQMSLAVGSNLISLSLLDFIT